MSIRFSFVKMLGLLLGFGLLCGCNRPDDIQQYVVPKAAAGAKTPGAPAGQPGEETQSENQSSAWFFKVQGQPDAVLKLALPFTKLVESVHFSEAGAPEYDVPPAWSIAQGPPPRHQTITIPESDPPLQLTVSTLPLRSPEVASYFLANINRWRGQLGLKEYSGDNWIETARTNGELKLLPSDASLAAIVNLSGAGEDKQPARMLAAIVVPRQSVAESAVPETQAPLTFETPSGWKADTGNAMRILSFKAIEAGKPDSEAVDISVSRFPGGGDIPMNVNRWRQQIGLDELPAPELEESLQTIEVDGRTATLTELLGKEQGIMAAILPDGEAKWFFKMQGPRTNIEQERDHFREFLKSIHFQPDQN
jgi:hypothetical protein